MNDSPIQDIKNKLNIVDVIREYINLEKAGSNYRALCPFHPEKTPSFFVNEARQIWRCFGGCGEGGDMFQFVMKIEGVEFGDALRILAKKAGVKLTKQNKEVETKRKRLFDICEIATSFYERQLWESKKGEVIRNYLKERGITEESIKEWRIGYSPTAKDSLSKFLIGEGYQKEEMIEAGVSTGKGGYSFDRFRARIMFPIFNLSGYSVGFGGRIFIKEDKRAKYINTPATILYDKSAIMYGMHSARIDIRKLGFAVVVEGYTDVILSHQAGFKNVISSSGTALTSRQLDILGRYTKKILTAFDMDEAGGAATKKGIDLALEKEFDVRVIMMPEGKDPADIVLENKNEWEKCIKDAKPVINFYFNNVLSKYDLSDAHEKGKAGKEIIPEIKKIKNSIERSHFVGELSRALGVSESSIYEEMEKIKENRSEIRENKIKEVKERTRKDLLEEKIACFCIKNEDLLKKIENRDIDLLKEEIKNIFRFLRKEKESIKEEEEDLLNYLSLLPYDEDVSKEEEFLNCLKEMKKESIKGKLQKTEEMIKEAERSGDEKKEEELIKKFQEYSKELQSL
jgi:DNA primase